MMGRIGLCGALLLWAHLAPCQLAAETFEESTTEGAPNDVQGAANAASPADEEVVVVGRRTVRRLRLELYRAQDQMHDLFNALNDDDELDIYCRMETHIDTHIKQRVCRSNYVDEATKVQAEASLAGLRGEFGSAQMPAEATIKYKNGILRKKFVELLDESPEFRQAVENYSLLRENFDAARRQILNNDEP